MGRWIARHAEPIIGLAVLALPIAFFLCTTYGN